MKAAIYMRVSTEEQRERQTIETQRVFAERYCEQAGVIVAGVYADDGVSGTLPLEERPEGARLLTDASEGRFDIVLVYRIDRLGRDSWIIEDALRRLRVLGVRFASMTELFDASTPHGKLLQSILGAAASYERDVFIARSVEATRRLAGEGAWLGGIVPYGYRVVGEGRERRLAVSEEPLPGLELSEAGVIRLIFQRCAEDGKSCVAIADELNILGIPPSYAKDERKVLRGKRREATAGIWREGRVQALLRSTTYKGVHLYGKRTKREAPPIERLCAPIVSEATWDAAQATLKRNFLYARRNSRRQYLLRSLIRCGKCGLTYVGTPASDYRDGRPRSYYRCSGRSNHRIIYGSLGCRCDNPNINGEQIEAIVMRDILRFLKNPETVVRQLRRRMQKEVGQAGKETRELQRLGKRLAGLLAERSRMLGLYRKALITEEELEKQLAEVRRETEASQVEMARIKSEVERENVLAERLADASELLSTLGRVDPGHLDWNTRRALVEALVGGIRVDSSVGPDGKTRAEVCVTYLFSSIYDRISNRTPTGAGVNPQLDRAYTIGWQRGGPKGGRR